MTEEILVTLYLRKILCSIYVKHNITQTAEKDLMFGSAQSRENARTFFFIVNNLGIYNVMITIQVGRLLNQQAN